MPGGWHPHVGGEGLPARQRVLWLHSQSEVPDSGQCSPDAGLITGRSCLEGFPTAQLPSPVVAGTGRFTGLREGILAPGARAGHRAAPAPHQPQQQAHHSCRDCPVTGTPHPTAFWSALRAIPQHEYLMPFPSVFQDFKGSRNAPTSGGRGTDVTANFFFPFLQRETHMSNTSIHTLTGLFG